MLYGFNWMKYLALCGSFANDQVSEDAGLKITAFDFLSNLQRRMCNKMSSNPGNLDQLLNMSLKLLVGSHYLYIF